ncbi:MAG: tripartite tricarboxylate transporter substrate binding protein [Hyphomicrobiales bacterium]|nr:tripartite tricarboxylate transporter substrate binding protein [Hyphomicrobiales bacterium]
MIRSVTALALLLSMMGAVPLKAQDYPTRPITVIVGFAAGGFADTVARVIGGKLSERLGQNVVIENRGGAGGNIAASAVAKAQPDGYTLLVTTTGLAFYEVLTANRTFALDELKAVAIPAWAPESLSVSPSHPARTLAEFVRAAQGKSISYASPGAGTLSHIAANYFFRQLAKLDSVHVPFQGGAPAVNAMAGGHVDALVGSVPGYVGQFRSGAIRALALASEKRLPQMPDVPTYGESGFPGFVAATWVGFFAPAKTSDAILVKLNGAINEVVRLPDVQERLAAYFMQLEQRSQPQSEAYFRGEIQTWRQMIAAIDMKPE